MSVSNLVQLIQRSPVQEECYSPAEVLPLRKKYLLMSLKKLLMVPILPLIGYFVFDATGVTDMLIHHNAVMTKIMGEGLGHAGLCFSLHYVLQSGRFFLKALFPYRI